MRPPLLIEWRVVTYQPESAGAGGLLPRWRFGLVISGVDWQRPARRVQEDSLMLSLVRFLLLVVPLAVCLAGCGDSKQAQTPPASIPLTKEMKPATPGQAQ
jgi:hypothetical protein